MTIEENPGDKDLPFLPQRLKDRPSKKFCMRSCMRRIEHGGSNSGEFVRCVALDLAQAVLCTAQAG
jgi:hypothetical protein